MTSPGLNVSHLDYAYGAKQVLQDVTFRIKQGQFCALLGPNGAGKSTLFALLTRLFTTPAGAIEIAGKNLATRPRQALAAMGVVFQQPTLDLDLTIRQNLRYFAALHGLAGKTAAIQIDAALDRLDIRDRQNERARTLNGGHRRRTEIARALVHNPLILLLDEPTVGLDAAARNAITTHVHDLTATGLTVLWATHLTDEVRHNDHLLILHQGHLLANDTAQAITQNQPLSKTFLDMTQTPILIGENTPGGSGGWPPGSAI
ncbi:ABC transporter ATP-binding protein [Actibacterium sp. 188UL27-1]|uniref:ABC transporter ATP-binding protein n=1 Tax=Actibacterium sp. 188UL27-1 TaxID=2786961 RepID=UPI0019565EBA|nr:ABC transporter ATP-binding protein [Actibacterium sp. 188UL27-1]MBM7066409.1 ATP-binding cassette domain-containing protein [Actibacterium sp. 188UL27-1]